MSKKASSLEEINDPVLTEIPYTYKVSSNTTFNLLDAWFLVFDMNLPKLLGDRLDPYPCLKSLAEKVVDMNLASAESEFFVSRVMIDWHASVLTLGNGKKVHNSLGRDLVRQLYVTFGEVYFGDHDVAFEEFDSCFDAVADGQWSDFFSSQLRHNAKLRSKVAKDRLSYFLWKTETLAPHLLTALCAMEANVKQAKHKMQAKFLKQTKSIVSDELQKAIDFVVASGYIVTPANSKDWH